MIPIQKRLQAALLCICILLLPGCSADAFNRAYNDDTIIAGGADSKLALTSIGGWSGDEYTLRATMTGTQTIWSYSATEDCELPISVLLSVAEGGKAKLGLVSPDDVVTTIVENTDNTVEEEPTEITLSLKKGQNRIKLVGYDAPKLELMLIAAKGDQ